MKKKILLALSIFTLGFAGSNWQQMKVYAQEEANSQQDYSYLLNDEAIIGQTETNPSGVYLLNGISTIQDAGTGKIIAGGITDCLQHFLRVCRINDKRIL